MAQYMTQEELADRLQRVYQTHAGYGDEWLEVANLVKSLTEIGEPIEFVPYRPGLYVTTKGHHPARVHEGTYSLSVLFPGRTDTFSPLTPCLWPALTPAEFTVPSLGELAEDEEDPSADEPDPVPEDPYVARSER